MEGDTLERILDQAERALKGETPRGLVDVPLGVFGLSPEKVFLGNIVAIAKTAIAKQAGGGR